MGRLNISAPAFEYDTDDPAGFRSGRFRLGPMLGAEQMGASVFATVRHPGAVVYPDSDKIAIHPGDEAGNLIVQRASGVGYSVGEIPDGGATAS